MVEIIQLGNPVLRDKSEPVKKEELGSDDLKRVLSDMSEALNSREDGIALSAPQIGVLKRIFVVSTKIFDEDYMIRGIDKGNYPHVYFLNPVITKFSKKKEVAEEGCLSIDGVYGLVERPKNVNIEAIDENGNKIERGAGGTLSRIFQHEIDHLDGVLFIDKATDIREIKNEK